ncbi:50S ribosomal protein L10 [Synechococcus sp. PCC 7336]|uniref:50S ribosomal protein L10 n=1 Tax=Synechococcus sp. PCC 7336 TaxID=195250 RepID=UPI0003489E74|nr:50S ribosomal protein L10 [Synechococcus sp. PCC 7336]
MGKQSLAQKQAIVASVEALLEESEMVMAIDYAALTVGEMSELRNQLYPTDSICMVVKNTLMRRAIAEKPDWEPIGQLLGGQSAFILIKGDVAAAIKAYQSFQKGAKKSECRGAVMAGTAYNFEQVKAIGELPSKEVLMSQVAGSINALATKLAVGIKEVPASLARAIAALEEQKKEAA